MRGNGNRQGPVCKKSDHPEGDEQANGNPFYQPVGTAEFDPDFGSYKHDWICYC
jgi:hypothetical protein